MHYYSEYSFFLMNIIDCIPVMLFVGEVPAVCKMFSSIFISFLLITVELYI